MEYLHSMNGQSTQKIVSEVLEKHDIRPYWLSRLVGCSASSINRIMNGHEPKPDLREEIVKLSRRSTEKVRAQVRAMRKSDQQSGRLKKAG